MRKAFTLVELLVVIAIMGVMMAMLLPAMASSREIARRAQCGQQIGRLVMAMHHYEAAQVHFPAAGWNDTAEIAHRPEGQHQSWTLALLPYLERQSIHRQFDFGSSVYAEKNVPLRNLTIDNFRCPSDASLQALPYAASSYAGCYHDAEAPIAEDSSGALVLNQPLRREAYVDGLAHTLFAGEKVSDSGDLGWTSATRSTLRNTGHVLNTTFTDHSAPTPAETFVGGFGGSHSTGAWFALGDGHTRFINDQVSHTTLQQLGHRSDGALLSDDSF